MNSFFSKVKFASAAPARPPAAVELSQEGALAAALHSGRESVYAFAPLPAGALVPGIADSNIRSADAVSAAIRSALGEVSPRHHSVTLVLPDSAVRIFILDFEALPAKPAEALPVLRLRLRKALPFDAEQAGIGYQVLSQNEEGLKVLIAVLPGPILAEYEAAVRSAGYEPGAVIPSSIAALEIINSMEAVLTAHLSSQALTTSITNGSELLLHRTLELPEDADARTAEIQRDIAVAAAFFEDKLHASAQEIRYSGSYDAAEFAGWIAETGLSIVELAPRPEVGALTSMAHISIAGAAGALVGAE